VDPTLPDSRYWVLRLIEFLELFLGAAGVRRYIFFLRADNPRFRAIVEKAGARQYATEDTPDGSLVWYEREVNTYGRE
jgi:hypothetical protein